MSSTIEDRAIPMFVPLFSFKGGERIGRITNWCQILEMKKLTLEEDEDDIGINSLFAMDYQVALADNPENTLVFVVESRFAGIPLRVLTLFDHSIRPGPSDVRMGASPININKHAASREWYENGFPIVAHVNAILRWFTLRTWPAYGTLPHLHLGISAEPGSPPDEEILLPAPLFPAGVDEAERLLGLEAPWTRPLIDFGAWLDTLEE